MKNYFDMVANNTAAIGDPVTLRGNVTSMVVESFDNGTYDVTVVWVAASNQEVHKYTFKAMMLDYVGI